MADNELIKQLLEAALDEMLRSQSAVNNAGHEKQCSDWYAEVSTTTECITRLWVQVCIQTLRLLRALLTVLQSHFAALSA